MKRVHLNGNKSDVLGLNGNIIAQEIAHMLLPEEVVVSEKTLSDLQDFFTRPELQLVLGQYLCDELDPDQQYDPSLDIGFFDDDMLFIELAQLSIDDIIDKAKEQASAEGIPFDDELEDLIIAFTAHVAYPIPSTEEHGSCIVEKRQHDIATLGDDESNIPLRDITDLGGEWYHHFHAVPDFRATWIRRCHQEDRKY